MLNIRHHTLALASAACALSTLAQAQQSVLITANRQAMAVDQTPSPVRTLDRRDLDSLPVTDLTEALATLPGVNIRRSGGPDGEPSLGLYGIAAQPRSSSSTTLAVNGVPLNNGIFPEASMNMLPLSLVQRVEVIQGPASSSYGNNARLGVVNLVTPQPTALSGELSASVARWNTDALGGYVGAALGGDGHVLLGFDLSQTDGHLQPKGNADFSDSQLKHLAIFADKHFGDLKLSAAFVRYSWGRDNPSYLVQPGAPAAANPRGAPTARWETGARQHANLSADLPLAPQWSATLTYSHNDYDEQTSFNAAYATPSGFGATAPTNQLTRSDGLVAKLDWETRANLLTAGVEHQTGTLTDRVAASTTRGHTTGWFVQDRYLALDGQLALSGGFRQDRFSFYDETSSSPRLGFVWKPTGQPWLLRGQSSRAFSAPSFNQLFGSFGNTQLVATTLQVNEVGVEFEPSRSLKLGATVFDTKTTKPIYPRPRNQNPICKPGPGNCFVNVGDVALTSGVTLDIRQQLGAGWDWGGSYTYLDPKESTFATSRHVLKLDTHWRAGPWTLSGVLRHEAGRYFQDGHLSPFPDFTVIDASLGYRVNASFDLSAVVENLSNQTYATTQIVSTSTAFAALPINRPERFVTLRGTYRF